MANEHASIAQLSQEQRHFILKEMDLIPGFLGWHRVQVQAGNKWLVYRDGLLVKQYGPGPYTWWNGFFHKWRAQVINTRTELLSIEVGGRVKGPAFAGEAAGTALDLACEVRMELRISVRIVDIENFLQYRDPLSVFFVSVENMVVEFIGQLRYDQYGEWATELRDRIREALQGGKYDAESRIGLRVEDVYVADLKPNTAHDRNMLAMYQLVERGRRELVEARANAQRDTIVASSYADQGRILNLAPSILALQKSPIGQALIERDAGLREMLVAAGFNPGVNVQPLQEGPAQIAGNTTSNLGYLNPAPPLVQNTPSPLPAQEVTGQLVPPGEPSGPLSPQNTGAFPSGSFPAQRSGSMTSPLASTTAPLPVIDEARREREIAALKSAGFEVAGRGSIGPASYERGQLVAGSQEWTIQAYRKREDGMFALDFHCPMGYPDTPPGVRVKPPAGGGWLSIAPNTVHTWHPDRLLAEVAQELFEKLL